MFCKNCGKDLRDDSQFCWDCGTKVEIKKDEPEPVTVDESPKKILCKNCGNEIYDKADICPHCGMRLRIVIINNPGIAAVLSFFVPGLGYVYIGEIIIGIAVFLIEILLLCIDIYLLRTYQLKEGLLFLIVGFIFWVYNVYSVYRATEKANARQYL